MSKSKKDNAPPEKYTTEEKRISHVGDMRLREHGFKIVRRPKDGPVVWGRDGREYTEKTAHRLVDEYIDGQC